MNKGLILAAGALGILGLVGVAAAATKEEEGPLPPPPRTKPGGTTARTPKQIAMAHPNYKDWLYAAEQCDIGLADTAANPDPGYASPLLGFCEDAAYFAKKMTDDGVPPGDWR